MAKLQEILRTLWNFFLEVAGENDYARYRTHSVSRGESPMTPETFYLSQVRHKYARPCRCC